MSWEMVRLRAESLLWGLSEGQSEPITEARWASQATSWRADWQRSPGVRVAGEAEQAECTREKDRGPDEAKSPEEEPPCSRNK